MKYFTQFHIGKYLGFFASFIIFTTILYFVTSKLHLHTFTYITFVAGFAIFYGVVRSIKGSVKSEFKTV